VNFNKLHNVYFIGIGGIGMSALARYFNNTGKAVYGYDRTETTLTQKMTSEGIKIHYEDDIDLIPGIISENKKTSIIIYTPAISNENTIYKYFSENKFEIYKRAEILGLITKNYKTIAVAGTHGKTSVSTIAAHIINNSSLACYAFLGGISKNTDSNLILPAVKSGKEIAVLEADEFDRSFLYINPDIALITSIDADHLDIYNNKAELVNSFGQFVKNIKQDGILICKKNITLLVNSSVIKFTYSLEDVADYHALNLKMNNDGTYCFDLVTPKGIIKGLETGIAGKINAENAVAAVAIAHVAGVNSEEIKIQIKSCKGVKRRFDFQILTENLVFIDDYAHHPEELKAFIISVKEIFPGKKITGVFQPHLFTRTRDFADEFAQSLNLLDELILLDIYPAREKPIKGVSSKIIFNKVNLNKKIMCTKNELIAHLKKSTHEVLLTMGAGDIDKLVEPIKEVYSGQYSVGSLRAEDRN